MHHTEVFVLALLGVVAASALVQSKVFVPQPIILLVAGLLIGIVPGVPNIQLDPQVVFLIFLPPILYAASLSTSWKEFRTRLRIIALLASVGVLVTMVSVALVAYWVIPTLGLSGAFLLGAVVSPPDAVAATTVIRRLGVHRYIMTILEGESLVNDATGLVAYKMGVVAAVTGTFSLWNASVDFVVDAVGGILLGVAVGWGTSWLRSRIENAPVEITISLLTPFGAYLISDQLSFSGVLATVTAGLYVGWRVPQIVSSATRIQWRAIWETVVFLLNGMVFLLIGLQMPGIMDRVLQRHGAWILLGWALLINATIIGTRFALVFSVYIPRFLSRRLRETNFRPQWRHLAVSAWSGMRGIVTLAAALALPLYTAEPAPLPERELIIFLSFSVILGTLMLLGLSLPCVIRKLNVIDDVRVEQEEVSTRLKTATIALARIEEVAAEERVPEEILIRLRREYERHIQYLEALLGRPTEANEDHSMSSELRLRQEGLAAARAELVRLRNEGEISYEAVHRIQYAFDLEEAGMERMSTTASGLGARPRSKG